MVCIRNLSGLILALAAAPSVLASSGAFNGIDILAREPQLGNLLNGGDDGSSSAVPSASPSDSPTSNTPTQVTTSAIQSTSVVTSNSPSQTPTSIEAHTTSAPHTSIPVSTSVDFALTTVTPSGSQSAVVVYRTLTTITGGQVATADVSTTLAAATTTPTSTPDQQQKVPTGTIVGAAVGGAGGLLLIAGLAAVAWRIWGKNRRRSDEDDELMGDGIYGTSEVKASGPTTGASPFQSNLEQYHNGRSNPSANF